MPNDMHGLLWLDHRPIPKDYRTMTTKIAVAYRQFKSFLNRLVLLRLKRVWSITRPYNWELQVMLAILAAVWVAIGFAFLAGVWR